MKTLLKTQALEIRTDHAQLVEPLSIELLPGQVLTIIGETGSGKSLFAQGIVGNLPQGLHARGQIELASGFSEQGRDDGRKKRWGRDLSVLPQEPWLSLDPTMRAFRRLLKATSLSPAGPRPLHAGWRAKTWRAWALSTRMTNFPLNCRGVWRSVWHSQRPMPAAPG